MKRMQCYSRAQRWASNGTHIRVLSAGTSFIWTADYAKNGRWRKKSCAGVVYWKICILTIWRPAHKSIGESCTKRVRKQLLARNDVMNKTNKPEPSLVSYMKSWQKRDSEHIFFRGLLRVQDSVACMNKQNRRKFWEQIIDIMDIITNETKLFSKLLSSWCFEGDSNCINQANCHWGTNSRNLYNQDAKGNKTSIKVNYSPTKSRYEPHMARKTRIARILNENELCVNTTATTNCI